MALYYDEPESGPPVATDRGLDGFHYQVEKAAFGGGGSPADVFRVEHGVPLPARDYYGGTELFDSGPLVIAAGSPGTELSDADIWVDLLLLCNLTGQDQRVSVSDGVGNSYGGQVLKPNEWRPHYLNGVLFAGGIIVSAENATSALGQVKGVR